MIKMSGHVDVYADGAIHGWYSDSKGRPVIVEIDGKFAGTTFANQDRPDVVTAGFAVGACGFSFRVARHFLDGRVHIITVRVEGGGAEAQIEGALRFPAVKVGPEPVPRKTRAAVVCWDLAHNPAGRAFALVQILRELFDQVDLIGPLHPRFGAQVWRPIAEQREARVISQAVRTHADLRALAERASTEKYDFLYICKPRWPSLMISTRIIEVSRCQVVLDVDDFELGFFSEHEEGRPVDRVSVRNKIERGEIQSYDLEGTLVAEQFIKKMPLLTVSSPSLRSRYGGKIIRHARRSHEFDPSRYDRNIIRKNLGYGVSDKVIAFIGTIRRHKGIVRLARAIADANDKSLKLCTVGPFDDQHLKRELIGILGDQVGMHEGVPFSSLPSMVMAADLVCLLQQAESVTATYQVPAKLTDALAMGVPVLLEDLPSFRDLQGLPGVFKLQPGPLSTQIHEVLSSSPGRADIRDTFLSRFSTNVAAKDLLQHVGLEGRLSEEVRAEMNEAFGIGGGRTRPQTGRLSPSILKRPGPDIVFLWKQNDSNLFGRRSDMLVKHLAGRPEVGRVIQIDASVSLTSVRQLESNASRQMLSDGMIYKNIAGRFLGLQDEMNVKRITNVYDDERREFLGRKLPAESELMDVFRMTIEEAALSKEAILWVCPVSFDFERIVGVRKWSKIVVDLIDDQREFKGHVEYKKRLNANYRAVISCADVVFANCNGVANRFRTLSPVDIHVVENAAEPMSISGRDIIKVCTEKNTVVVGYIGNLRERIDAPLLWKLLEADERYRLVLVGPSGENEEIEKLARSRKVICTGPVSYSDANRIAAGFDVAILPHLNNRLTDTMNPLKLYVYQALGLPTVATGVANLGVIGDAVLVATSHQEFLEGVAAASSMPRRKRGRRFGDMWWSSRTEVMLEVLGLRRGYSTRGGSAGPSRTFSDVA